MCSITQQKSGGSRTEKESKFKKKKMAYFQGEPHPGPDPTGHLWSVNDVSVCRVLKHRA